MASWTFFCDAVLQEIDRIRQRSTHEGKSRDEQLKDYKTRIVHAVKTYMPLSVSWAFRDQAFSTGYVDDDYTPVAIYHRFNENKVV